MSSTGSLENAWQKLENEKPNICLCEQVWCPIVYTLNNPLQQTVPKLSENLRRILRMLIAIHCMKLVLTFNNNQAGFCLCYQAKSFPTVEMLLSHIKGSEISQSAGWATLFRNRNLWWATNSLMSLQCSHLIDWQHTSPVWGEIPLYISLSAWLTLDN